MPAGVSLSMVAAVLLPICVVTLLLRELPFSFIKALKDSQFIGLLGMTMPVGVMTVLVVYTVFGQKSTRRNPRRSDWCGDYCRAALVEEGLGPLHLWRHRCLHGAG